jgi:molybdopterin converting factor small subunit
MARSEHITIHVPRELRAYCEGASELALAAGSVRAVLEELERRHPSLYRGICDDTGAVRRHVNLFVNNDHMRDRDGLDTALAPGDEIMILPAVSGGSLSEKRAGPCQRFWGESPRFCQSTWEC